MALTSCLMSSRDLKSRCPNSFHYRPINIELWVFRVASGQSLSKVLRIVVEDGFREGPQEHRCYGATGYHKKAADGHDCRCRKGCILRVVLQVGEEDTAGSRQLGVHYNPANAGQAGHQIGHRGLEYQDNLDPKADAVQGEVGNTVVHAALVVPVDLAEADLQPEEEGTSCCAKDEGFLQKSYRHTADANQIAVGGFRRES